MNTARGIVTLSVVSLLLLANPLRGQMHRDLQQEIMQAEDALLRAVLERDEKTLQRLLSDDVVATGTTGKVLNKSQLIETWTQHDPQFVDESSEISEPSVRVYGIAAILNATITDEYKDNQGRHKT